MALLQRTISSIEMCCKSDYGFLSSMFSTFHDKLTRAVNT